MSYFYLLTSMLLITGSMLPAAETFQVGLDKADNEKEIDLINIEIKAIGTRLHEYRIKAMNIETKAQTDFIDHWGEFADLQEKHEDTEKEVEFLKKQLNLLKERREELLKPHSSGRS